MPDAPRNDHDNAVNNLIKSCDGSQSCGNAENTIMGKKSGVVVAAVAGTFVKNAAPLFRLGKQPGDDEGSSSESSDDSDDSDDDHENDADTILGRKQEDGNRSMDAENEGDFCQRRHSNEHTRATDRRDVRDGHVGVCCGSDSIVGQIASSEKNRLPVSSTACNLAALSTDQQHNATRARFSQNETKTARVETEQWGQQQMQQQHPRQHQNQQLKRDNQQSRELPSEPMRKSFSLALSYEEEGSKDNMAINRGICLASSAAPLFEDD